MSKAYATLVEQFFRDLDRGWAYQIDQTAESLERYIVDHAHEFPNSCLHLTHEDINFNIPIDTNDNDVVTAAIVGVAECGYGELLKTLIPFWTTPDSTALQKAVYSGHIGSVKLLLGVCDATFDNSVALGQACVNRDTEIFNLLLPVSDAKAALDLLIRAKYHQGNLRNNECFERLQSIVQRQTIEENIPSTGHTAQRKM